MAKAAGEFTQWLAEQPQFLGTGWIATLEERKQEEAGFHDSDRADQRDLNPESTPNRRFYEAAKVVDAHIQEWMRRNAPNGPFLDYACGNGKMTVAAVRAGAPVAVGIDISEVSVRNATETAAAAGCGPRAWFLQRDCEATGFQENTFAASLCSGMLHHLDLPRAYEELHRVMAPGGRILCVEALAYNPFIKMYRNRTPELRTAWEKEHILSLQDVELARRWFQVENVKFHLMSAPLATFLPAGPLRKAGIAVGHLIDGVFTRIPGIQRWSWQFSFELVKKK